MRILIMSMSILIFLYYILMKNFGLILKELRTDRKINQTELAIELKVSQSMIARWEKGECEPKASNIIAIADYFNVTTDYLLGRSDY